MTKILKKITAWPHKKLVLGVISLVSALILAVSFFSFNPYDPSWMYHSSESFVIKNFLGAFGANMSAFFFYTFGMSAWVLVGLLCYGAYFLLFNRTITLQWDRLLGLFVLPITMSAILNWYSYDIFNVATSGALPGGVSPGGVAPGGVVGGAVYNFVLGWFESVGAGVFIHCLIVINLIVLFPKTFLSLMFMTKQTVQFIFNREKFLKPAYKILKKTAHVISVPFIYTYHFVRRLFSGADVLESDQSIVDFEQQLLDQVEGEQDFAQDDFWNEYTGNKPLEAEQTIKVATKIKVSENKLAENSKKEKQHSVGKQHFASIEQEQQKKQYSLPTGDLFLKEDTSVDDEKFMTELQKRAKILEEKLEKFGVYGSVVSIKRGPVVTLFEYKPKIDSKISKIISLEDDLALALQALSIRIIAPIPGKSVVGLEVANATRKNVLLSSLIHSREFKKYKGSIPLVLGKDTIGNDVMVDLVKMPHLLIAGSTGSGKSVALNTFLVSMLCKLTPDQLKLILVDPKRLEFASYADIPHLLFPIVTDPKKTAPILRWVVNQMEERYEKMAQVGARNLFDYNEIIKKQEKKYKGATKNDDVAQLVHEVLPFIVIVIDELSDLMMTTGRDIEDLIARIAQMARAAGIHMIVATQRPSVDVITGLIKVNFPSRVSFRVSSRVDSRTILDCGGAEKLLGSGDMLFIDSGSSMLRRLHGAYVSNKEIDALADHVRSERAVQYLDISEELSDSNSKLSDQDDVLYKDVMVFLNTVDEVSISLLQRKFRIGYNRSARIIDILESQGVVMPSEGSKMRKVIH